jgi:hypothetical protein
MCGFLERDLWEFSPDTKESMKLGFSWKFQKSLPSQGQLDKKCSSCDRTQGQMLKENFRFIMASLKERDTVAGWDFHWLSISKEEQKGEFKDKRIHIGTKHSHSFVWTSSGC